jgi:hypothetical protein
VFDRIDGFDDTLVTGEDTDIGRRLVQRGYLIVEDPAIAVIHHGGAKTLREFFNKRKWHTIGSLRSTEFRRPDKVMIMTGAFTLSWISALAVLPLSIIGAVHPLVVVILLLAVPTITALYRAMSYRRRRHILSLVLIYAVFYLARLSGMAQFVFEKHSQRRAVANRRKID